MTLASLVKTLKALHLRLCHRLVQAQAQAKLNLHKHEASRSNKSPGIVMFVVSASVSHPIRIEFTMIMTLVPEHASISKQVRVADAVWARCVRQASAATVSNMGCLSQATRHVEHVRL